MPREEDLLVFALQRPPRLSQNLFKESNMQERFFTKTFFQSLKKNISNKSSSTWIIAWSRPT